MMTDITEFKAWRVHQEGERFSGREETMPLASLPEGEVLIRVSHSSLNYKDALSASGNPGVTREFPHTPGIDAAGTVVEADGDNPAADTPVIVTGYDLGMNTPGGFGEYIRVPRAWVAEMPAGWNARKAMIYGTAGLTAGLCVSKLLRMGASKDDGPVAVTGASGAVGTVAVEILSVLGFEVVAISGKPDQRAQLENLGATEVLDRDQLAEQKKPMLKPRFAHAVDTVGGNPLAELLKQIRPGGSVACCGLVAGPQLQTTVLPFILRGVNLLGVDSVEIPLSEKQAVWDKLASDWACPKTEQSARDIGRSELDSALQAFLKGESAGKIVLDHGL
jgi:acrylyl-CoA reductase (NADPH)